MRTTRPVDPRHPSPSGGIDELVGRTNPLTGAQLAAFESVHGFDDLFEHITRQVVAASVAAAGATTEPTRRHRARKRRPRRRTVVDISLAVTLLFGGATAVGAAWTSVHTGFFGQRRDTEDKPGAEFLDLAGDDMPQVAAHLAKGIPFPPGDNVRAYIPGLVSSGGLMQAVGVQEYLASDSVCAWWGYWLQSNRAGDAAGRSRATAVLGQAPTWPEVVETDGGGVVTLYKQGGRGVPHRVAAAGRHPGWPRSTAVAVRSRAPSARESPQVMTGETPGAIRVRLHRARAQLRARLARAGVFAGDEGVALLVER